ncbi:hypothetical protein [uncultured Serinicoccus sp.]|uniref:hypothetical protein n=1 Tax=uncultured Serinicoccus sp. TaxID=735514 RepID=UPI0026391B2B|nr:hypothetical protein [uncultured Serinicoccus sp.]
MQRLILAYDSDCSTCREMSNRVEAVSNGKIATLPLTHPDVTKWRQAEMLLDRWQPTLFKFSPSGDLIGGRTGPPMIPWLATALTIGEQTAVLGEIGEMHVQSSPNLENFLGRRKFAKVVLGLGATVNLLFWGANAPAIAASPGGPSGMESRVLSQTEKRKILANLAESNDLNEILTSPSLRKEVSDSSFVSQLDLVSDPHDFALEQRALGGVYITASATADMAVVGMPGGRMLSWRSNKRSMNGTHSEAILWDIAADDSKVVPLEISHNGRLDDMTSLASNCGACYNRPYKYRAVRCEYDVACLGSGCGSCKRVCKRGIPWQVCVACVAAWCGGLLAKCCQVTPGACRACVD